MALSKIKTTEPKSVTLTVASGADITINANTSKQIGNVLYLQADITVNSTVNEYAFMIHFGNNALLTLMNGNHVLFSVPYGTPVTGTGIYYDYQNSGIRACAGGVPAGRYWVYCVIPVINA